MKLTNKIIYWACAILTIVPFIISSGMFMLSLGELPNYIMIIYFKILTVSLAIMTVISFVMWFLSSFDNIGPVIITFLMWFIYWNLVATNSIEIKSDLFAVILIILPVFTYSLIFGLTHFIRKFIKKKK